MIHIRHSLPAVLQAGIAAMLVWSAPVQAQATDAVWRRYAPDKAAIQSSEAKLWLSVSCTNVRGQEQPSYTLDVTITDPAGYALPEHRAAFAEIARNVGDSQGIDGLVVTHKSDGSMGNMIVLKRQIAGDSYRFRAALLPTEVSAIRSASQFIASFMLSGTTTLLRYPFSGTGSGDALRQLACGGTRAAGQTRAIPDFAIGEVIPANASRAWPERGRNRWKHTGGALLYHVGRMEESYEVFAMGDRYLVYLAAMAGPARDAGAPDWKVLTKGTIVREPQETEALDCHPDGEQSAVTFVNLRTGWARGIIARGNQLIGKRWRTADAKFCRVEP